MEWGFWSWNMLLNLWILKFFDEIRRNLQQIRWKSKCKWRGLERVEGERLRFLGVFRRPGADLVVACIGSPLVSRSGKVFQFYVVSLFLSSLVLFLESLGLKGFDFFVHWRCWWDWRWRERFASRSIEEGAAESEEESELKRELPCRSRWRRRRKLGWELGRRPWRRGWAHARRRRWCWQFIFTEDEQRENTMEGKFDL